jgi:Peptidase C13 family
VKELWLILKAALRAAVWKSTPVPPSGTIRAVFIWIIASIAAEAARQYFAIDEAAAFSIYGINSIIAEMAVLVTVALLLFSLNRTAAIAQLFALVILVDLVSIVASRLPAIAAATVLAAVGLLFFSRNRTAVLSKLFALAILAELLAIVVTRLPTFDLTAGMWTATDSTVLSFILRLVWWIGAATAILRNTLGPYESPFLRALGLTVTSAIAIARLPAFPTFVGGDFDLSSYNVWEWAYTKFDRAVPEVDTAAIELSQPSLVEAEVKRLLPEQKGKADIYAIGIAGWSDQDVFIKELNGGLAALDKAMGLDRGTVRLVNHADTIATLPIASRTNFASAVHAVAKIMNRDEDVLLIFITSHGGPTGVGLRLSGAFSAILSPDHIATVLDREGIKNRVLIVSACYAGVFVKRLASPDSVVLTAADENSVSFGCSSERDWTYFGDALFNQNLGAGVSLEEAFENAKGRISQWEARDEAPPSNPQGFFGSSLSKKLHLNLGTGDTRHIFAN